MDVFILVFIFRNSGKNGQASNNRTLEAFKNIKLE